MHRWLIVLLRILFPLDPVAQLGHVTRYFIGTIIDSFNDPDWMDQVETLDEARAILEAKIASAEEGLQLLIHERACQLLGHPYWYVRRPLEYPRRRARPMAEILARLARVLALQDRVEELAQRRAARIRCEQEENPLRLAPPAQSTSPSLRLVEATHRALFAVQIASLSAQHWGRWHARPRGLM
jgi:hypothetical protein